MDNYNSQFNFQEYFTLKNIEDVIGWDGYIDPKGRFYLTKPNNANYWNGSYNLHADFADDYLRIIKKINDIDYTIKEGIKNGRIKDSFLMGAKDYLVNVLGWVSIGYSNYQNEVYTCVPVENYCGLKPTKQQKEIAFKLYQLNNYDMDDYYFKFEGKIIELSNEEIQNINKFKLEDE